MASSSSSSFYNHLFWIFILVLPLIHCTRSDEDWTKHCNKCSCRWVSGKKSANCSNLGFDAIPKDLSAVVREIDFSYNPLYTLSDEEFISAKLEDIHKLKFQNCSINMVNEGAFRRLALIIELDLSRNSITELKKNTFKDTIKLRILLLSFNKIRKLETGLFNNISFIQRIHIDHNQIEQIDEHTFENLPSLTDISLGYNQLKTVNFDIKLSLPKLASLNIEENPWICDCQLELFHQSVLKNNLITHTTNCSAPPKMRGKIWISGESFPCAPIIIQPSLFIPAITASSSNITLICQVVGEPEPNVDWINMNGHRIEKDPRKNREKYFSSKRKLGNYTWNNLTIVNLNYRDRGEYKCIAQNAGGEDSKNITLIVDADALSGGVIAGLGSPGLIIGLSIGLIVLLLIILILVCLFCRKVNSRNNNESKRSDMMGISSSSEEIHLNSNHEMKKGLITEVNPINKPPRTLPSSVIVTGGTEVSDAKINLLDSESVFDYDDESRSFDFEQPLLQKSHNHLVEIDYNRQNTQYPPDLLAFPPRMQISPTGSNASTLVIESRLPPSHGPQSPLHTPIYDQISIYRTLPYSRSHSPFTPSSIGGIPRVPKQGYVTIPRKPRQSWSSEPPPSSEQGFIGEPLYDNLGVRCTADGSSVLSLNKAGIEPSSTPRSNRFLPLSPTTIIDPIVESHESPNNSGQQEQLQQNPQSSSYSTSSATLAAQIRSSDNKPLPAVRQKPKPPQKPTVIGSQTLPRNLHSKKLSVNKPQHQRIDAENIPISDKRHSVSADNEHHHHHHHIPLTDEGKPKKVPPRPPPKPPKTPLKSSAGPLFEDEGEDGTEV